MTSDQIMEAAGKYLAYKSRTRKELVDHLRKKGASRDQAEECADRMQEYHLIDDLEYSRLYMESKLAMGLGMARIQIELTARGVDRNTIEDARLLLEDMPDEGEEALRQALAALEGYRLTEMDYGQKQKIMARIARRLAGRGYRTDAVYTAVRTAFARKEEKEKED